MANNNVRKHDGDVRLLICIGLALAEPFSYFGLGSILYWTVMVAGALYVWRRPGEGIWVIFFLLAVTSLVYPVSLDETGVPDVGAFRPYNLVIAGMVAALLLGMRKRHRSAGEAVQSRQGPFKWIVGLACVFLVATIFGDLSPMRAGALYVLQQSSAWVSFFLFLWLGYRVFLSPTEIRESFSKLHLSAFVYSGIFLAKFAYVVQDSGLPAAVDFAYAQRVVLFFVGIVLVVLIARKLAPEAGKGAKISWLSIAVLIPAIVLSGSRGVIGSVALTILVLLGSWRLRSLLRLTPLLLVLLLIFVVILRTRSQVVEEYIVAKFFVAPEQDASFMGRVSEMEAAVGAVQRNPLLGNGMLASYMFFDPYFGWRETAFVDNGFGYLLMKTGLLGTSIFTLLIFACFKMLRHLRRSIPEHALIPLVVFLFYLAYLPFGASFFDLRYSWLVGMISGYSLYLAGLNGQIINSWAKETEGNGNRSAHSYA